MNHSVFDVSVRDKLIDATRKILQSIVISLAEINEMMVITKYIVSLPHSKKGYKLDPEIVITEDLAIPKFISKLGVFFPQVKPKKKNSIPNFTSPIPLI